MLIKERQREEKSKGVSQYSEALASWYVKKNFNAYI